MLAIAAAAAEWMQAQDWPGNYDELARTVLNGACFAQGEHLTLAAISAGWPMEETADAIAAAPPLKLRRIAAVLLAGDD